MVNANLGDIAADVLRFLHSGKSGNHLGCGGQHPSLNQLVPVFQIAAESCCQKIFLPQHEAPAFMSNELIAIATRPRPRTAGRTRPTRPQSSIRAVAARFCILQFYIKISPQARTACIHLLDNRARHGPKRFHCGDELILIVQTADRCGDHLHQLVLLRTQIGWKQLTQLRRNREQAIIEKIGGRILNWDDPCESRTYQRDVIGNICIFSESSLLHAWPDVSPGPNDVLEADLQRALKFLENFLEIYVCG
jgi:hypothetical protein